MIEKRLIDISRNISSGITPLRSNDEFWTDGAIPWLKTEQLGEKYIFDTNEHITEKALQEANVKIFPENTLSIAMYGEGKTRGNVSILKRPMATNQACCNIELDEERVSSEYVYYFLKTQYENLRGLSSGVRKNLNTNDIKNFVVRLPENLKTQQSIAAVLSALDKKIALNKQINARLEEIAKTLYDYWFVQFDFPDANGKPYKFSGGNMVFDETLKREIPKGWEVRSLNQVADIVMGQSPDGASYNLEQEGTIFFQGSTDFDWRFPNVRQYTTSPTRFAQKGDILLSVRAPVGDLNISPFECCIGRGLAALRSKSGNNSFLFYVMKYFKTVFERRNTEGTTFGSITKDDLHSLKLVAPADNVLEKYNEIASKYDEMIFIGSQQNHQLTQLRDFLLPMLMNGQVSVVE
ncbi:TPA: restriction endonuclease subunit S [Neisseria gonorrhoeae]